MIIHKTYFTDEITLQAAKTVNTEQLQHYIPYKHGLFLVHNFKDLNFLDRSPSMKFHGNPSSESRADTCWQTGKLQTDGWADITKVTGAFDDYANVCSTLS